MVAGPNQRNVRLIILGMFAALLQSNSGLKLDPYARPIIIVEDPETRLHPIMLSVAWGLLNLFSLQRITTTNSGELLSLVPIHDICRLVRESTRVAAYRLGKTICHRKSCGVSHSISALTARRHCLPAAGCWWRVKRKSG